MNPCIALRLARGGEAASGIFAAVFTGSLLGLAGGKPAPATAIGAGAAALTLWLTWRLKRPTRPVLAVAGVIVAATIVHAIGSLVLTGDTFDRSLIDEIGDLVSVGWFLSQFVVGVALWHARDSLRRKRPPDSDVAAA